jgi:hypothetical protein
MAGFDAAKILRMVDAGCLDGRQLIARALLDGRRIVIGSQRSRNGPERERSEAHAGPN